MTLWLDNQLPPALAVWMRTTLVETAWPTILPMLERGETLVELGEQPETAS